MIFLNIFYAIFIFGYFLHVENSICRPITPNNSAPCYTFDNVNTTGNSDFYENFAVKLSSTELATTGLYIIKFYFLWLWMTQFWERCTRSSC